MVFSSPIFLFAFLPIIFILYLMIKPIWGRNALLILASLIFYAFGEPVYVFLMILSAFVNYLFGLFLGARERGRGLRRLCLVLAVVLNLSVLGVFKYAAFILENINTWFHADFPIPEIALPIGISFYTFQALSYVIDVYRDAGHSQKNFARVLLYISFFPQLIAGPIIRWTDIEGQLSCRKVDVDLIIKGIQRFVTGLFKKLIFANGLGAVATEVFAMDIGRYSFLVAWFGAICYALQIYYDFSGYSDMAIGLAGMFGFRFRENFEHPYSACSIQDFWRRWHISLTSWFREYVYIPLGGNRRGKFRTECNKMLVFFLTGIWHGANWTFLLWGLFHGVVNVLEDTVLPIKKCGIRVIGNLYTWVIAVTAFAMFRADTATQGFQMIRAMFSNFFLDQESLAYLQGISPYIAVVLILAVLLCYPVFRKMSARVKRAWESRGGIYTGVRYAGILVLLVVCVCNLASASYNPFIYFRF